MNVNQVTNGHYGDGVIVVVLAVSRVVGGHFPWTNRTTKREIKLFFISMFVQL